MEENLDNDLEQRILESKRGPSAGRRVNNQDGNVIVHNPDPTKYHNAAMVLGPAFANSGAQVNGYVVPGHTVGGGQLGQNRHKPGQVEVFDGVSGSRFTVDLSVVTPEMAQEAYEAGKVSSDAGTASALVYARLAKLAVESIKKTTVRINQVSPASSEVERMPVQQVTAINAPSVPLSSVKRASFKPDSSAAKPPSESLKSAATHAAAEEVCPIPKVRVEFEVEGVYQMEAHYHQVIVNDPCLVLVYDRRCKTGSRFVPAAREDSAFVRIEGSDEVYMVDVLGIGFPIDNYDVSILIIKSMASVEGMVE